MFHMALLIQRVDEDVVDVCDDVVAEHVIDETLKYAECTR